MGLALAAFILGAVALRLVPIRPASPAVQTVHDPAAGDDLLTMDFIRQPYLHHNPGGLRFGDAARLLHYTLWSEEVQAGEPLTVTLDWQAAAGKSLTATVRLVSAAEPLFGESPIAATSSLSLQAGRTDHRLGVPHAAVPGPYLLAVELRHEEGSLRPMTPGGRRLGTTYLRPVWVKAAEREDSPGEPLARFGERIALLGAQVERRSPRRLSVHLTWRALQPLPANYNLSLRLRDPSGQQIAVRDLQPHYGLYPTSIWVPGVAVEDFLVLPIPEDTPAGDEYTLEVILYPVSTLIPVGQVRVRDIRLTEGLN